MIVARSIVDDITESNLEPGDPLPSEQEMLRRYSVGRGTLREALRYLEAQGVLWVKQGRGPIVDMPDSGHLANALALLLQMRGVAFEEIVRARQVIEPAIAAMAAEETSDSCLKELRDSVQSMSESLGDVRGFFRHNAEFHDLIAQRAGNSFFVLLLASLHGIDDGIGQGVGYSEATQAEILKAHMFIVDAVEAHDGARAHAAMKRHMDHYYKYLKANYAHLLHRTIRWDQQTSR